MYFQEPTAMSQWCTIHLRRLTNIDQLLARSPVFAITDFLREFSEENHQPQCCQQPLNGAPEATLQWKNCHPNKQQNPAKTTKENNAYQQFTRLNETS